MDTKPVLCDGKIDVIIRGDLKDVKFLFGR